MSFIVFPNPDPTAGLDSSQDTGGIDFQTLVGGHTLSTADSTDPIGTAVRPVATESRAMSRFFVW